MPQIWLQKNDHNLRNSGISFVADPGNSAEKLRVGMGAWSHNRFTSVVSYRFAQLVAATTFTKLFFLLLFSATLVVAGGAAFLASGHQKEWGQAMFKSYSLLNNAPGHEPKTQNAKKRENAKTTKTEIPDPIPLNPKPLTGHPFAIQNPKLASEPKL
jgi:hypothetical protein